MIRFSCKWCGKRYRAPDQCAGRADHCHACGKPVWVPQQYLHFTCGCGKNYRTPVKYAGRTVPCRQCGSPVTAPEMAPKDPPPAPLPAGAVPSPANSPFELDQQPMPRLPDMDDLAYEFLADAPHARFQADLGDFQLDEPLEVAEEDPDPPAEPAPIARPYQPRSETPTEPLPPREQAAVTPPGRSHAPLAEAPAAPADMYPGPPPIPIAAPPPGSLPPGGGGLGWGVAARGASPPPRPSPIEGEGDVAPVVEAPFVHRPQDYALEAQSVEQRVEPPETPRRPEPVKKQRGCPHCGSESAYAVHGRSPFGVLLMIGGALGGVAAASSIQENWLSVLVTLTLFVIAVIGSFLRRSIMVCAKCERRVY